MYSPLVAHLALHLVNARLMSGQMILEVTLVIELTRTNMADDVLQLADMHQFEMRR